MTAHLRAQTYDPAYNRVPGAVLEYRGTPHTVAKMIELCLGPRGEKSIMVRRHAEQIVANLRPKDYASECMAIYYWWMRAGRYTRDPVHVELLKDPQRMVEDADAGRLVCDCDELATGIATDCLVVGSKARFVTVSFKNRQHPSWLPGSRAAREGPYTHVFAQAQDPRTGIWWTLDPVAGRRVERMQQRVKQMRIYPIG
ncbi:MAG TPA: hypothetical protein VIY27_09080 [Myxococcota bacterium]